MAQGPPVEAALLGYDFVDWDKRTSFTWKFLRESTRAQVDSVVTAILHADNRLTTGRVLRRVLSPTPTHNEHGWACRGLYCADGAVPPPFLGHEFDATATMYIPSGATVIDSADIEDAVELVQRHGWGVDGNGQMLILANPIEAKAIRGFRAGQPSRPSGPEASYDFIPSVNKPPYTTEKTLVGQPVSDNFDGVKVWGSYDVSLLIESPFVPAGYVIVAASGGKGSPLNVVGFREHTLPEHRGLRLIAGQGIYPLVDSFAARAFGVGVRHRAGAAVIQVTSGSVYSPPPDSAIPI